MKTLVKDVDLTSAQQRSLTIRIWTAVLLTIMLCMVTMGVYLKNTLHGNIDYHTLPAEFFGLPHKLQEHGLTPLYFGPNQVGWDGQFYYSMANDVFAQNDTAKHLDATAYRYQRIGPSAFAAAVAKLTCQNWVSPTTYYLSNLFIVLSGTIAGAYLLKKHKLEPLLILFWSLSVGTQLTLVNGLPDAAADAFLIIGLALMAYGRNWAALMSMAMASLSREAYIIFPFFIGLWSLVTHMSVGERHALSKAARGWIFSTRPLPFLFAGLVFGAWQLYVRVHFQVSPTTQAHGILNRPLVDWWKAFSSALGDNHYLVPRQSLNEGLALLFFLLLIVVAILLAGINLKKRGLCQPLELGGTSVATIVLGALYLCFGQTVMMHYTGYLKAAALLLVLVPLLAKSSSPIMRWVVCIVLVVGTTFSAKYFWQDRILPKAMPLFDKYTCVSRITRKTPLKKLSDYQVEIRLVTIEPLTADSFFNHYFSKPTQIVWVDITNRSKDVFDSAHALGSVNYSYHWLASDGITVLGDGIRTMLTESLHPGATARVALVVPLLDIKGDCILRVSPVQEGYAWFYQANPTSRLDIPFRN